MINKIIERLKKQGKLREKKVGVVQVEALLKQAMLDLKEAQKISNVAERATYLLAYMAMLKAGKALLLLQGYIPDDGAQHKTIIEITSVILGNAFRDLTEQFESMRRKRNMMTYEAGMLLSKSEAKKALSDSIVLVHKILVKVKSLNPQLELKFDL